MTRVNVQPYLLPAPERIRSVEWRQNLDGQDVLLQELLPHWDPGTSLNVSVILEVNPDGIRNDCCLIPNDPLRAVILWYSPGTGLRGRGKYVDLGNSNYSVPVTLNLVLLGELLADRIRIEVQVISIRSKISNASISPRLPGSILWREERFVILEGVATRFPTELIDFSKSSWLPENASWFLEWDPIELDQMALRTIRLYINAGNPKIKRAVTEFVPADEVIREVINFDVGRTMIYGAFDNEAFMQHPDSYIDGSVGSYLRRLIYTLFPNDSLASLVQSYRQNRSRFECILQDRFKLFQEV